MKIHILGTEWSFEYRSCSEDSRLDDCDGYSDWTMRLIVVRREIDGNLGDMDKYMKKVARHEIVHAYMFECGLAECSGSTDAWAMNEIMVDWIARMMPRVYETWKEADVI